MSKLRIEKEPVVKNTDIVSIDNEINILNSSIEELTLNDKSILFYKEKVILMLSLSLARLRKDRIKCVFNFQKRDDHGFFSLKTANDELEKIDENIGILKTLSFQIDISFFFTNSVEFSILKDLFIENYNIDCLIDECSKFDFLTEFVKRLQSATKNFKRNKSDIESSINKDVLKETKGLKELNQDAVTKHIITKELFELIKEYLELLQPNNNYNLNFDDNKLQIHSELLQPENNNYYTFYLNLCNIEKMNLNLDSKYKNCIVDIDIENVKGIYYKLYIINSIKNIVNNTILKQKDILRSLTKKQLFTGYLKYLSECIYILENIEKSIIDELNNFDINSYIELFSMLQALEQYNYEIESYKTKLEETDDDILKINYNNKKTSFTIKIKNIESKLIKNKYFKHNSNISQKTGIEDERNMDDEIKKQDQRLVETFKSVSDISDLDMLRTQYDKDGISTIQSFIEYLIICGRLELAKVLVEKNKLLELLYTKYIQGDISISFEEYILNNNQITSKEYITSNDIIEFEKNKIVEQGSSKVKKNN